MIPLHCHICQSGMQVHAGTRSDINDGVTIWCANADCKSPDGTPCQEVMGHGNTEQAAYAIVKEKYHARPKN